MRRTKACSHAAQSPEVARRILGGQGDALAELQRRATDPAFDALWKGIDRARAGQPIEEVGQFENQRRTVKVSVSGLSLAVEVPPGDAFQVADVAAAREVGERRPGADDVGTGAGAGAPAVTSTA